MTATKERSSILASRNGCVGWEDERGGYHRCATDDLPILAKGRCTRCYSRARTAERAKARQEETETAIATLAPEPETTPEPTPAPGLFALFEPVAAEPMAAGYDWILFDAPPHNPSPTEPRISVVKDGNCRLNAAAYALWGHEVKAVEILHDRRRAAIALRPCDPRLPHARQLRPDKGARSCSLRAFQRATGILRDGAHAGRPQLVGTMLVLELPGGAA